MVRFNQARRVLKPHSVLSQPQSTRGRDNIESDTDLHDDDANDVAGLDADGAGGGAPEESEQPAGGDGHHHHQAEEGAARQGHHRGDAPAANQDEDVHESHSTEEPDDRSPG